MNKKITIITLLFLLFISSTVFAEQTKVNVLLNQELKITFDSNVQEFFDVSWNKVYPLSYEGSTYLPLRAVSCLLKTPIEWNEAEYTVYLGKGETDDRAARTVSQFIKGKNENVNALLNKELKIKFNGEVQTFKNANNQVVYPLSYEGTTYLPIRAISELYGVKIGWDEASNTVSIVGKNKWNGTFISVDNGYREIELKSDEDGKFKFNIKGYTIFNEHILANECEGKIEEDTGYYTNSDNKNAISFKIEDKKLTVSAITTEYEALNGEYMLDNTANTIKVKYDSDWDGVYQKGDNVLYLKKIGNSLKCTYYKVKTDSNGTEFYIEKALLQISKEDGKKADGNDMNGEDIELTFTDGKAKFDTLSESLKDFIGTYEKNSINSFVFNDYKAMSNNGWTKSGTILLW